jgi:hypoxanthine phosphoribosyltransferase
LVRRVPPAKERKTLQELERLSEKLYLDAQDLLEDSFQLAANLYHSGFRPTFIVAVWRGGAPIGIAVQEYFAYQGVDTDHIAIRTSAYTGIDERSRKVAVYGLSYLVKNLTHADSLLIVDDVFDTGHTIKAIIDDIRQKLRLNTPNDIRIAVPYYKPARNQTDMTPDYFIHETERWLKYPHSLEGLSREEIRSNRPEIYAIIGKHLENASTP